MGLISEKIFFRLHIFELAHFKLLLNCYLYHPVLDLEKK